MTLKAFLKNDAGQGLVEYAVIVALVSIVAILSLKLLGNRTNNMINNTAAQLS